MRDPAPGAKPIRVLLVEDDENDALLLLRRLERDGYAPVAERVCDWTSMEEALARSEFDVVLSDFTMPGFDALQALRAVGTSGKDLPFIVVSGTIGEDVAVQVMKAGAHDYFSKGNLGRLGTAIERELREARVRRERREALEAQRATEERLRLVVESVKEYAIYMLDLRGAVASWHGGAERVYGYAEREIVGEPFARFFPPEDAAAGRPEEILARVHSEGTHQCEVPQVCKGGSIFWADATLARLRDEAGRPRGFSVVARDITEQAKLLEELRVALRARDEFLSMASHELRTPVTTLQLQLQTIRRVLERAENAPPLLLDRTENLERQTSRIARLVGELLDLSRMRLGKLELRVEEVDVAELARDVLERLRDHAARAGCALAMRVTGPTELGCDRLRIEQVVTNLVENAIKFGGAKPIAVSVDGGADGVGITVEDEGIGIAPRDQARVFDRFERAAPAENYAGLGLGLYIARQIVEAHGGTIHVRSTLGRGSAFTVELPRTQPERRPDDRAAPRVSP